MNSTCCFPSLGPQLAPVGDSVLGPRSCRSSGGGAAAVAPGHPGGTARARQGRN